MSRPALPHASIRTAIAAIVLLFLAAAWPQAQQRAIGGVGITVFDNPDYGGRSATYREATPDLSSSGMNDRITSLRVAPGELWEVCEHANYQGRCQVFSGDERDLRRLDWNDMISSLRPVSGPGGRGRGRGGIQPPVAGPSRLVLFSGLQFAGASRAFNGDTPDLRRVGFDDQALSLRVEGIGTWEICRDANYRNCTIVSRNLESLQPLGFARQISSVRRGRQLQTDEEAQAESTSRLVLYDNRRFGGRTFELSRDMAVLVGFVNRAESVRIIGGGTWELCDGQRFTGTCRIVNRDVADLSSYGLRNRVASARRVR
ncbi:MAG: beta/gamma crystallin-related protein [Vicinamibacterales bacterium]